MNLIGNGYPGRLVPYECGPELQHRLDRYNLTAGWFYRAPIDPEEYFLDRTKCNANEITYVLYKPQYARGKGKVPMVIYFGGSGEQGTNVTKQFHQSTLFSKLTAKEFQERHPCYIFAPMFPKGAVFRGGQPGRPSCVSDLTCDAMYAIIRTLKFPPVDTNRLYLTGLSYGGGAAYEFPCLYPGRFAAGLPVSTYQDPRMIPTNRPVNFWLFHNQDSYCMESSKQSLIALGKAVRAHGGEFRVSTFPDIGHNAWTKAWSEKGAWEWMFSKTANGEPVRGEGSSRPRPASTAKEKQSAGVFLKGLTCTASQPGADERHGPERAADNLDDTSYVSAGPMGKDDWWMVEFPEPISGRFILYSGTPDGEETLRNAHVETSSDGKFWNRGTNFKKSTGTCTVTLQTKIRFLRVVPGHGKPEVMTLRELFIEKGNSH